MSKQLSDEGQHQQNPATPPGVQGEEDIGGSSPAPTSDDDVEEMVEEVIGEKPQPGETIADIVNKSEHERVHPTDKDEKVPEE